LKNTEEALSFSLFMKIIYLLLTSVLLSVFCSYSYSQDNVKDLLITGDTQKIRQAARIMSSGEQNTPENSHFLANIIALEFESAPSNRIDALSWGCRALAATGDDQYIPLLEKIYQSRVAHKKLKKYAKKAYQALTATSLNASTSTLSKKNSMSLPVNLPINESKHIIPKVSLTRTERKLFAIAKGEWQAVNLIAQQLATADKPDTQLLDALSQFLVEKHIYSLDNKKTDVLAWVCRALGQSNSGRYQSVLDTVANKDTNRKLQNYAISARNGLTNTATPYIIGSINFKKIINEFTQYK
jgi:hypothetical protein